jgi:hypothetical protein
LSVGQIGQLLDHYSWGDVQREMAEPYTRGEYAEISKRIPDCGRGAYVIIGKPAQLEAPSRSFL